MRMTAKLLGEAGHEFALLGLSLSYRAELGKMPERAEKNAPLDGGHNKFLESIYLWIDVNAPRYWWQEADTYRLTTKQSESSMHTIMKRTLTQEDFNEDIDQYILDKINDKIAEAHILQTASKQTGADTDKLKKEMDTAFRWVKRHLPEAFLQRRVWTINYKNLRNIHQQRHNHKLPEWRVFLNPIMSAIEHPTYITVGVPNVVE
jgi:hypothetical protein